jgi:hypothetical protein
MDGALKLVCVFVLSDGMLTRSTLQGFLTVQAAMEAEVAVGGGRTWGGVLHGYSHPTYFGMMCASFSRNPSVARLVTAAVTSGTNKGGSAWSNSPARL